MVVSQATRQHTSSRFLEHLHGPTRPVLVFDGATGTSLQDLGLTAEDFGGPDLEGCNENLAVTKPDAVKAVHRKFLEVGCDVIETDTFGAASIVLAEYGLEDKAFELNKRAAELAREMADEFSTPEKPRFVAGSMGPTTKLPTLGHIDFDTMRDSFREQAEGLIAGNVDLLIVETCQDVLQIKAALQGIEQAFEATGERRALMVSVTMETTGTMLVGTDIAAVVSRGGRPDLAGTALRRLRAPTLLIVGGHDPQVLSLNEAALGELPGQKRMAIVPGATHLFEEPGTLDEVARLAAEWFGRHLH